MDTIMGHNTVCAPASFLRFSAALFGQWNCDGEYAAAGGLGSFLPIYKANLLWYNSENGNDHLK